MAYSYNDIRNPDWYSRLQAQISAGSMKSIQATGSEADDPFWAARRNQALGDLSAAREEAMRGSRENWAINQRNMQEREKARQRAISAALARDWRPDQLLGTQAEESAGGPSMPVLEGFQDIRDQVDVPGPARPVAGPSAYAPQAYAAPMSGGARPQRSAVAYRPYKAYNPSQFMNDELERRKRGLNNFYIQMSKNPVY